MSDPVTTARTARESLARGLNALQSDPNVKPESSPAGGAQGRCPAEIDHPRPTEIDIRNLDIERFAEGARQIDLQLEYIVVGVV